MNVFHGDVQFSHCLFLLKHLSATVFPLQQKLTGLLNTSYSAELLNENFCLPIGWGGLRQLHSFCYVKFFRPTDFNCLKFNQLTWSSPEGYIQTISYSYFICGSFISPPTASSRSVFTCIDATVAYGERGASIPGSLWSRLHPMHSNEHRISEIHVRGRSGNHLKISSWSTQ
jgi:hypothetical protein